MKKSSSKLSKPSNFSRFNKFKAPAPAAVEALETVSPQKSGGSRGWTPSEQQQAIFAAVQKTSDNVVVEAGAGCGKTTTTIEAVKPLAGKQKVILLAFNKSIADELQEKVPEGIEARTLHSLGFAAIRKAVYGVGRPNKDKVEDAAQELFPKQDFPRLPNEDNRAHTNRYFGFVAAVRKLVSLTKNYGVRHTDVDMLADMIGTYGLTIMPTEELAQQVNMLLDNSFNNVKSVDFDDMLWLPIVHGWKLDQYDLVAVDESQDLNPLRQQYVLRAGKRTMVIGDSKQSIYGFCGADTASMSNMTNYLSQRGKTVQLPLNITRRCPKLHVQMANQIFPGALEAAPEAPEGTFAKSDVANLFATLQSQDFLLCRTNAPLLWAAFQMVKAKRPVVLLGRDFGDGLKYVIRSCSGDTQSEYFRKLDAWYHEQMTKFDGDSPKLERIRATIQDKYESIVAVSEGCENSAQAINVIDMLFSDESRAGAVTMSSIHKAKGLEAHRVLIMCPHLLPHPMCKAEWELEQEKNLEYVAKTRSKSHLELIEGDYRKVGK